MKNRHVIAVAAALAALTGCSSPAEPAAAPAPETPPASAAAASAPAAAQPSASIDPGTLDATSAYLVALGKVDQRLIKDVQTALNNGQQVCVDVEERRSAADQEKNITTRFAVDAGQAKQILALTKANLCLE